MSGDKIVLLDGMGGSGLDAATSGLLSMVPSMFASAFTTNKTDEALVKAVLMHLEDPDVPEGTPFVRWLAVQGFAREKINWKDFI